MNYAAIKKTDIANGPGVRVSLFVSGCPHHCKGCFNQETWDYNYGKHYSIETENEIIEAGKPSHIAGLTVLGGEPLCKDNILAVDLLIQRFRKEYPDKSIWVYTGWTFDELVDISRRSMKNYSDSIKNIFNNIDCLVDGRFELDKKDLTLKFRGSSNQRIIDMNATKMDIYAPYNQHPVKLWSPDNAKPKKKLFVSTPMANKTEEQIRNIFDEALKFMKDAYRGYDIELIDTYITESYSSPIMYLAKSLELMAKADIVFMASGWNKTSGCKIEFLTAKSYNIPIHGFNLSNSEANNLMEAINANVDQ